MAGLINLAWSLIINYMWFFAYTKTLVCFANSRKYGGRCVAGKEWHRGATGQWVRPVSARPAQELMENDFRCADGAPARVLDILDISFKPGGKRAYQRENRLIKNGVAWKRAGALSWDDLAAWLDTPKSLWSLGQSSASGLNNRVAEGSTQGESLYLIGVDYLHLLVGPKSVAPQDAKRVVRGEFLYRGARYRLAVTDPVIEQYVLGRPDNVYFLPDPVLCVSLGEPFQGHYYKLIASVLTQKRCGS